MARSEILHDQNSRGRWMPRRVEPAGCPRMVLGHELLTADVGCGFQQPGVALSVAGAALQLALATCVADPAGRGGSAQVPAAPIESPSRPRVVGVSARCSSRFRPRPRPARGWKRSACSWGHRDDPCRREPSPDARPERKLARRKAAGEDQAGIPCLPGRAKGRSSSNSLRDAHIETRVGRPAPHLEEA